LLQPPDCDDICANFIMLEGSAISQWGRVRTGAAVQVYDNDAED
jgi:hypothetical protein